MAQRALLKLYLLDIEDVETEEARRLQLKWTKIDQAVGARSVERQEKLCADGESYIRHLQRYSAKRDAWRLWTQQKRDRRVEKERREQAKVLGEIKQRKDTEDEYVSGSTFACVLSGIR